MCTYTVKWTEHLGIVKGSISVKGQCSGFYQDVMIHPEPIGPVTSPDTSTLLRIARFSNVEHLSIHLSRNFGAESTRVYYIGLRGEFTQVGVWVLCVWKWSMFGLN